MSNAATAIARLGERNHHYPFVTRQLLGVIRGQAIGNDNFMWITSKLLTDAIDSFLNTLRFIERFYAH